MTSNTRVTQWERLPNFGGASELSGMLLNPGEEEPGDVVILARVVVLAAAKSVRCESMHFTQGMRIGGGPADPTDLPSVTMVTARPPAGRST